MAMSRTTRRVVIGLGGLIGLVVVLVAAAYGVLQTSWAHEKIAAEIEQALSSDALHVKVGAVDGALPQSITLRNVTASDDTGVFARIGTLRLTWQPWRLLFKSVDIGSVAITDASLDRLPHSAPSTGPQTPSSSAPFSLPSFGITVSSISLDMALGPALTDGTPERLKASGSARYGMGDGVHLNLDATQGGTNGSRLTARIHANPDNQTLELNVHAHEAKGGLASRLIGVAEDGPFDIDVAGDGTLANWTGTAKASLGPNGRLDATIKASGETTHNVRITGTATTPTPLTGRLEPLAASPYDFDINVAVARGGRLTFKGTTIKTAGAGVVANGTVDLSNGSLDMALGIKPDDAAVAADLTAPFTVPDLALNAHLRGYLSKPFVELSSTVPSLSGDGLTAGQSNLTAELDFDTGDPDTLFTFDASAKLAKLTFARGEGPPDPPSDVVLRTKGAYHGRIGRLSFGDLMVRSDWASVDFAGGVDLTGNAAAMVSGRLTAELRGLPMGGPALADFFKEPARLRSSVVYMPEGERIKFAKLTLTHPKISAEGDIEVGFSPQLLRGGFKARIANPAAFSKLAGVDLAGGPINITLATGPSGTAVNSTVTATADTLTISGTRLKAIKAALTLKDVETQSGSLDIAFTGPAGAVKATTDISRSENPSRVALNGLRLTAVGGELHGDLTVPLGEGPTTGALEGQFASLDAVSALVGKNLHGAATFSVSFSDIDGQQGVTGNLKADNFSADLAPDSKVTIKHLAVATGGDITKLARGVPFSLDAEGLETRDAMLDKLAVSGTTNFHSADYKIDASGAYRGAMTLSAAGSADWDKPEKTLHIESLSGTHAKTPIQLVKPASVTLTETGFELAPTTFEIGDGRVTLGATRGGGALKGHLMLDDLPLSAVRAFVPDGPADGSLSGTADIDVGPQRQSGGAKFQIADLALTPGEKAPERLSGTIDATWRNAGLDLKGQFAGQGGAMISAAASVPLRYETATGSFRLPENGQLRGEVNWNADVGPFWNAFGADTETFDGRAEASLKLGGTVSDPTATGDVTLHDGRFVDLEMGTVLENLNLRLEAGRQQIRLVEASASDGGSGKVTAKGSIGLDRDEDFPIQLDVTADKAKLVRRTDVTATVSGSLSFDKTGDGSTLKGMIRADDIDAILVDLSSPDVVKLDVTEIGPDGKVLSPPHDQEATAGQKATQLDVSVNVPGHAFIRGRGLDSEWKGNLKVTGPVVNPRIVGAFNVVRGNFKFAGRTFDLDRGQISFQGGDKIDPELNLQATYSVTDLTAMVNVTGPSSAPKIKLSSTPALPQDEILSRILFGSSVADLSPLQAVQLADAVRGLGKPGGGLLGSARSVVGLDVLQIGSSSQGSGLEATTITGGKYIAKNVYLEVETAANGGQEKVGVDLGLTKNLSVQSDVSPQQGTRLGLKWKHDY